MVVVVVIMVMAVDTSNYVTDVWFLSAVYHVHDSLDHWLLVHGADGWGIRHCTGHWLLVDGVRVCALVDCSSGCLVRDGVNNWGLRYRCGGVTGTSSYRDVARLETQQVVVGLCVRQLGTLRFGGNCGCVYTCGEVDVWVVESTVQCSREVRGNAWVFTAEDGGQDGSLARVAGGREVGWYGVSRSAIPLEARCKAGGSAG